MTISSGKSKSTIGLWINNHIVILFKRSVAYVTNKKPYDHLGPIDNALQSKPYIEALNWALSQKSHIKNIAITGPYGSGKSSIIKTFQKQHPEKRNFLNISLASFKKGHLSSTKTAKNISENPPKTAKAPEEFDSKEIELSILQQVFYHVAQSKLPDSRFKRVVKVNNAWVFFFTSCLLIASFCMTALWKPESLLEVKLASTLANEFRETLFYILVTDLFVLSFFILKHLTRLFNRSMFNKISLTTGTLEIDKNNTGSILNKYLDEILYFFQINPFRIVVIEDLDRFESPEIFTKLREINFLLNQSDQLNKNIVFIYAIKDDMFVDQLERTKFFDFIVPIVPVIHSSNSYEHLIKGLELTGIKFNSMSFLKDITLFIDDMRLLKNIINEFLIYADALQKISLNAQMLFSMIVYKNMFPTDFAALHHSKGYLFKALHQDKLSFTKQLRNNNREGIRKAKHRIERINELALHNISELRSLYIMAFVNRYPQATAIIIDGAKTSFTNLVQDHFFDIFKNSNNIQYTDFQSLTHSSGIHFKILEDAVNANEGYAERLQLLIDRKSYENGQLDQSIKILEEEYAKLTSLRLEDLLDRYPDSVSYLSEEVRSKPLLLYMLRRGLINETYCNYTCYFYEGTLSVEDKEFVMSVKNFDPLSSDFKLQQVKGILEYLDPAELERPDALNHNLISFLCAHKDSYSQHFEAIINQLANESATSISFINEHFDKEYDYTTLFINHLCKYWNNIWDYISHGSGYTPSKIDHCIRLILLAADAKDIGNLKSYQTLSTHLSKNPDFLKILSGDDGKTSTENTERLMEVIRTLNIKFEFLNFDQDHSELFGFIYATNSYQINPDMMGNIVLNAEPKHPELSALYWRANYTAITQSSRISLLDYINNNINLYIRTVFMLEDNSSESEEAYMSILANENISSDCVDMVIDKLPFKLDTTSGLNTDVIKKLFNSNRIVPSWDTIFKYYESTEELDDDLISYLNSPDNFTWLGKALIKNEVAQYEDLDDQLSGALLVENRLDDKAYSHLIRSISESYVDLPLNTLSTNKVLSLILKKKIGLDSATFNSVASSHNSLIATFIECNISTFLANPSLYSIDAHHYAHLLSSKKVSTNRKLEILDLFDDALILSSNELATAMGKILLNDIIYELSFDTFRAVLATLNVDDQVRLLIQYIDTFNRTQIRTLLSYLPHPYRELSVSRRQPIFDKTPLNLELLQHMISKDIITKFKDEWRGYRAFNRSL